jgi:hypothetical protein
MSLIFALNPPHKAKKGSKMAKKRKKSRKGRKASRRAKRRNPGRKVKHFKFAPKSRKARKSIKKALIQGGWASVGSSGATYLNPRRGSRLSRIGRIGRLGSLYRPYRPLGLGLGLRRNGPMFASPNSYSLSLKRGKKASAVQKRHVAKRWGKIVRRGPRAGQVRLNPIGGMNVVGVAKSALGMGAGVLLAQKVVPTLGARFLPAVATSGPVGLAVNTLGAIVAGRLIGKAAKSQAVATQIFAGAITSLGVNLVGMIIRALPTSITSAVGLSGMGDVVSAGQLVRDEALYSPSMRDYLQLSGPVPEQLFAGGMNDYVDFQSPAAGRAAEAISAQVTEWTPPANEQF